MDKPGDGVVEFCSRDLLLPIAHLEGISDLPRALFAREALEHAYPVVASARASARVSRWPSRMWRASASR